jgi:hypothetical protein
MVARYPAALAYASRKRGRRGHLVSAPSAETNLLEFLTLTATGGRLTARYSVPAGPPISNHRSLIPFHPFDALDACSGQASHVCASPGYSIGLSSELCNVATG